MGSEVLAIMLSLAIFIAMFTVTLIINLGDKYEL